MKTLSPKTVSFLFFILIFIQTNLVALPAVPTIVCDPTTNGGSISGNQIGGVGGFDPSLISNISLASGGSGTIEYKWMTSTIPVVNTLGNTYWQDVPGETSATFDPAFITKTTYVIRVSKSNTCYNWGEQSNMITLQVPSTPVTACLLYAVQDKKSSDFSQLFTVDVFNGNTVTNLGPPLNGWDIEGLEVDKNTGILYGSSGNDNEHGFDGYFYSIDAVNGNLNIIGSTGYDDVVSLAFNPLSNVLYAWVDDYGLITINTSTGAGTMVYSSPLDFDGMAWSNDGAILYVATDDMELSTFDPVTGTITLLTNTLPGPVESLEMRPDGNLMFGTHLASTTIYTINPQTLVINSSNNILTPFDDIESIVWPDWCSLSISIDVQKTDVSCFNANDGAIQLSGMGGVSPYSYTWSNGLSTNSDSHLIAGSYSVTVTDANGVSQTTIVNIGQPTALLNASIQTTQVTCAGGLTDGGMTTLVTGGTAPYTYSWSNSGNTSFLSALIPGNYSVTITDANGCSTVANSGIPSICCNITNAGIISGTQSNCGPFDPGAISNALFAVGGVGNLEYVWLQSLVNVPNLQGNPHWSMIPGSNSPSYDPGTLTQTTYFIRCARTSTCNFFAGESNIIEVTVNPEVSVTLTSSQNVLCYGGANGGISILATGTQPISYLWSNGDTNRNLTNIGAGTYTLTVTDANSCTDEIQAIIQEPTVLIGSSMVNTSVSIHGGSNGSVTALANGGTPTYTYAWNTGASSAVVTGLTAGTYSVTITDANGCSTTTTSTVTEPTVLTSSTTVIVHVDCNGNATGEAGVSANGAVSPYAYTWSNGSNTAIISSLIAGTYTVTITDAHGATTTNSVFVTEPTALLVTVQATQVTCGGGLSNGSLSTVISGGSAPFSFVWSNGQTTQSISGLTSGNYLVTVTDGNGCSSISNGTIATLCCNVTFAGEIGGAQTSCSAFDPTVLTSVTLPSGGIGNIEYIWLSSLVNVPNTPGNPDWSMITGSTNASYDPGVVSQTTYYIRCARRSNCSSFSGESNIITVEVNTNNLVTSLVQVVSGCSNEMFEAALGYNVFVKENVTVKTNETEGAMALGGDLTLAGNYTLAGNSTGSFQDQGDAQNSALVVGGSVNYSSQSGMNVVNNGFVKICDVSGSNIHDWDTQNNQAQNTRISAGNNNSNPRINLSIHQSATSITKCPIDFDDAFVRLNATAQSLAACSSTLQMSSTGPNRKQVILASNAKNVLNVDWNDLKNLQEFKFVNQPNANSSLLINVNNSGNTNVSWKVPNFPGIGDQHGQYIIWNFYNTTTITLKGGGTLKGTLLAPNADLVDNNSGNIDGQLIVNSFYHNGGEMHNYLFAGNIEGCAAGNCETPVNGTLSICSNANAIIKAKGGDSYLWSTGATTAQTTLGVGIHTVTVTNASGCSNIETLTITALSGTIAVANVTDVTCHGSADGLVALNITSGLAPYTYSWSTGSSSSSISHLSAGTYTVTITNVYGCEEIKQIVVNEPNVLNVTSVITDNSCNAANTVCDFNLGGYVHGQVVTGNLVQLGITVSSTANRGSLHDLIIFNTDLSGTRDSDLEVKRGNILIFPENNVDHNNDGIYDLPDDTPQGGTITLTFAKTRKVISFDFIDKDNGSNGYAKAYDENNNLIANKPIVNMGNGSIQPINLNASGVKKLVIYFYNSGGIGNFQFDCDENPICDGVIALTTMGGTAPYSYSWSNGATTSTITEACAGSYQVTITDASGCATVENVNVEEPIALSGSIMGYNATHRNSCNGYIDMVSMTGGTPYYSYVWNTGETTSGIEDLCTGSYSVTVTDDKGCQAKGGLTLKSGGGVCGRNNYGNNGERDGITTGSGVNTNETDLISKTIYPNPSQDDFTLEFSTRNSGFVSVVLYDFAGNMIDVLYNDYVEGNEIMTTSYTKGSSLSSGVYTIAIKTDGFTTYERLIIQ